MPQQPSYTVPPSRKPSFVNTGIVKGAAIGMLFAWFFPPAPAVGAVIGSAVRRNKMQQEEQFGKVVHPPTTWNKGTFFGAATGAGFALVMSAAIIGAGALLAVATGGAAAPAAAVLIKAAIGLVASTAICGWIGNKISQHFQKKEYQRAENFAMQHGEFISPAERQQAIAMGQALAPAGPAPMQAPAMSPSGNLAQAGTQLNPADVEALRAQAARGQQMALDEMLARQAAGNPQGRFAEQVQAQSVRPVSVSAGRS